MPVVFQSPEVSREYRWLHVWHHHPSGESARTAYHYADPVKVVAAYEFFHPTVSGALIISGREAAVESNTAGQTGMGVVTVAAQGGDFTAKRITAEFVRSAVAPARFWSSFVTTGVYASKPCWRVRPG
jgi:hypothetical protein